MKLSTIVRTLNKELKVRSIKDDSKNGLQVKASKDINKIGFAVDASMETFEKAIKLGCDLLIVHHGLLWKPVKKEALLTKRLNYLKKNKLSLYASHLPLDMHPKLGNNAQLCELFDIKEKRKFGYYHGSAIGYVGKLKKTMTIKSFVKLVNQKLKTSSKTLLFGKIKVRTVGVVSGGGLAMLPEAIRKKVDVYLNGEVKHTFYHYVKEGNLNLIAAGHYATETCGLKAVKKNIEENFDVKTVFIDIPTKL